MTIIDDLAAAGIECETAVAYDSISSTSWIEKCEGHSPEVGPCALKDQADAMFAALARIAIGYKRKHRVAEAWCASNRRRAEKAEADRNAALEQLGGETFSVSCLREELDSLAAERDRIEREANDAGHYAAEELNELLSQLRTVKAERDEWEQRHEVQLLRAENLIHQRDEAERKWRHAEAERDDAAEGARIQADRRSAEEMRVVGFKVMWSRAVERAEKAEAERDALAAANLTANGHIADLGKKVARHIKNSERRVERIQSLRNYARELDAERDLAHGHILQLETELEEARSDPHKGEWKRKFLQAAADRDHAHDLVVALEGEVARLRVCIGCGHIKNTPPNSTDCHRCNAWEHAIPKPTWPTDWYSEEVVLAARREAGA